MKSPFVDHSWTKIVEGKFEPELVKVCVDSKIKQLDEVAEIIRSNNGSEAVENVLEYKFVLRALEQRINTKTLASEIRDRIWKKPGRPAL